MAVKFVLVRIDDRLMHGQVAVGWVKSVCPDHIIIANDAVNKDSVQKMLIEMATPPQCGLTICEVSQVAEIITRKELDGEKVMILFSSSKDVVEAVAKGLVFKKLNIGGIRYSPGKNQIMKAVAIDDEDVISFKALLAKEIDITIQMVPTDEPVAIGRYLKD